VAGLPSTAALVAPPAASRSQQTCSPWHGQYQTGAAAPLR
jgi:hypothetical protein